jgi:predicted RecA/RadA family phage recombinase
MATAIFKRGEVRTALYTAGADIAINEVVILGVVDAKKCHVGVARQAIASGDTGIVAVTGVFEFAKVTGAVIKAGESVNWDSSAGAVEDNAHTTGAGDVAQFGTALADAGSGVLVLDVDIAEPGTYDAA